MAFQIAVLGGGPGGYVAAIRAAQLGASVVLVEKDRLGGTCLNRGCIPTKVLTTGAGIFAMLQRAGVFGIELSDCRVDYARLVAHKDEVVKRLGGGIQFLMQRHKIEIVYGQGHLQTPGSIEVSSGDGFRELRADKIILATGSEPTLIPSLGFNGHSVVTSTEALAWQELPESLFIIGGGIVGCEFASIFNILGAKVTLVEALPNLLPSIDQEIGRRLQVLFQQRGITVYTKSLIESVKEEEGGIKAMLAGGKEIKARKALVSIGRMLNTPTLGLDKLGIQTGMRGEVLVDEHLNTNVPGIYAIGDITGKAQLAHLASAQGITAATHALKGTGTMDYSAVPSCIFTLPEIATVGLSEQSAREQGVKIRTGKFPFLASGKALSMGETDGFIKILAREEDDQVVGVHIIGPHATDLIAEATLAVRLGATASQVAASIHAHPTLAEGLAEAAEAVHGLSIHS